MLGLRMSPPQLASRMMAIGSLLGACTHGGSPRLQGHWRGVRAEGIPAQAQPAANAFATAVELVVRGDTIAVSAPKEKQSGHYKVVKDEATTLVITTDKDGPGEPQTFTFVDPNTMKWSVLGERTIVFVKQ
jgi:hypothetical protein